MCLRLLLCSSKVEHRTSTTLCTCWRPFLTPSATKKEKKRRHQSEGAPSPLCPSPSCALTRQMNIYHASSAILITRGSFPRESSITIYSFSDAWHREWRPRFCTRTPPTGTSAHIDLRISCCVKATSPSRSETQFTTACIAPSFPDGCLV